MSPGSIRDRLAAAARRLGFHAFGVAPAVPLAEHREFLAQWLALGYAGEMSYLAEHEAQRSDPTRLLAGAKSVVCVLVDYGEDGTFVPSSGSSAGDGGVAESGGGGEADSCAGVVGDSQAGGGAPSPAVPDQEIAGKIARYARGRDYHIVLKKRLQKLGEALVELVPGARYRPAVDSLPLLERAYAWRAGLGFFGKNTLLLRPGMGSYTLLGELLTDVELPPDEPGEGTCGRCTRCLDACPTGAFDGPFRLDATKCISYWNIETRGPLPPGADLHGWAFGCDICQEVCPYNHGVEHPPVGGDFATPRAAGAAVTAADLAPLTDRERFRDRFAGTPLMRAGRDGLRRNLAALAGEGDPGG